MKEFLRKHGWMLFNLYLFANVAGWCAWQAWKTWQEGRLDYVEASFILQNVVFAGVILVRKRHRKIEGKWLPQLVALAAFWSWMLFVRQEPTGGPAVALAARGLTVAANLLGLACLLNLGRSFGILIACRTIKTTGLYGLVRHPMYGTDILLRIGILVGHCNLWTATLFVVSTGAYVWRALLEERFLAAADPEYAAYMQRVRWRFIPGVF